MAFIRVLKSKAYFKRYQVKYRRRRGELPPKFAHADAPELYGAIAKGIQ